MLKKEKVIRFTAVALVVLIIYSLLSVGLNPSIQRINLNYGEDDQPGKVLIAFKDGITKVFSKPDAAAKTKDKKIILQDSIIIQPSSQNSYSGYVLVKFSDKSQGWLKFSEINRIYFPKGRETEIEIIRFLGKFGSLTMLAIMAAISLSVSYLLFRFYPKINEYFTKRSEKLLSENQNPWFFLVALIIGVALGYLFFFYRGRSVQLLSGGGFLTPGMELENMLLFFSFWGFLISCAILILQSIKEYGSSIGTQRAILYIILMLIIILALFFFVSAAIYLLIIIIFFLGGSKKIEQPKFCPVCGVRQGADHTKMCPNSSSPFRAKDYQEYHRLSYPERVYGQNKS